MIHAITESPLVVSTVYADAGNQITFGCDLALDVDGTHYVADRDCWGCGELVSVSGGIATSLAPLNECRALSADPMGGLFVSEWNGLGFDGVVERYDFATAFLNPVAGFDGINFSNGVADADTVVDVQGYVYAAAQDEGAVLRYLPGKQGFERVLSGYTKPLSGLQLAPSTPASGSTTGWSLWVTDHDHLYELVSSQPPASPLVDSTVPRAGAPLALLPPRFGRPVDLVSDPDGETLFVATEPGTLLEVDVTAGAVQVLAGSTDGLPAELAALARRADGRLVAASRGGQVVEVDPASSRVETLVQAPTLSSLDVRGLALDAHERIVLVDRSGEEGRIVRFAGGRFETLARSPGGLRAARDPRTGGLVFTLEDGGGSLGALGRGRRELRTTGSAITDLAFGDADGGLAFDAAGNLYLAAGPTGRVLRVDRTTGAVLAVSGNHARPVAVAVTTSTLFVLDGWTVFAMALDARGRADDRRRPR